MNDHNREKEIFNEALELPADQRAQFLSEKCADNPELRRRIEYLLARADQESLEHSPANEILRSIVFRLADGQLIGRKYRILEPLGVGGTAEVYKIRDNLGRPFALKILNEQLSQNKTRLEQFKNEAIAAGNIGNENIIKVHEFGESDGISYIVTEYFEGETLRRKIESSELKIETILEIIKKVAEGLEAVHEKRIIHRDIKPENIMAKIGSDGKLEVRILDFGIAKLTDFNLFADGNSTIPLERADLAANFGTPRYLSPEQVKNTDPDRTKELEIDTRSDIWSLGVCLYEMLTGQKPFAGETRREIYSSIEKDEYLPLNETVPQKFKNIIDRSLRKDREERYQTIAALRQDLRKEETPPQREASPIMDERMNTFGSWLGSYGKKISSILLLICFFCILVSLLYAIYGSSLFHKNLANSKEMIDNSENHITNIIKKDPQDQRVQLLQSDYEEAKQIVFDRKKEESKKNPASQSNEPPKNDYQDYEGAKQIVHDREKEENKENSAAQSDKSPEAKIKRGADILQDIRLALEAEINGEAINVRAKRLSTEFLNIDCAKIIQEIGSFSHIILIGIAFFYLLTKLSIKQFPPIENDLEDDQLKANVIYSTGYEKKDVWKTARKAAILAMNKFKIYFIGLLAGWCVLYFVLVWNFLQEKDFLPFLLTQANNANTLALWLCFSILNEPISTEIRTAESKNVKMTESPKILSGVIGFTAGIMFIWFFLDILFSTNNDGQSHYFYKYSKLISGVLGGIAMALLIGRLQSKFLSSPTPLVIALYAYTVIQTLFIFFGDETFESELWAAIVINSALFLKCLLILYTFWLFESGRLLFYLVRVKRADTQIISQWQAFRETLAGKKS